MIDHQEARRTRVTGVLERDGFEVATVSNGGAALEWLAQHSADLVLLHPDLADLPASELIRRVRERDRDVPFIVLPGHGDEAFADGAFDCVIADAERIDLLPALVRRSLASADRERELARALETVRQLERRHRDMIQTAPDGFAQFDARGRFVEINRALCELVDRDPEAVMRGTLFDLIDPPFAEEFRERLTALGAGGSARVSTRLRSRHGVPVEVAIALRSEGREMFAFFHDVSEQRRLEREILHAGEDEKRRIGRELHDGLGQHLTALEFMSQALARSLKSRAPDLSESAEEISRHIRQTITQTRRLSHGLAPMRLEDEGLGHALAELASAASASGVACTLEAEALIQPAEARAAIHLYRIAQESVTNALKHADARRIALRLSESPASIELEIADDGHGMRSGKRGESGMGLQVMNYRARLIGARLVIDQSPAGGVRITCTLPRQKEGPSVGRAP